MEQVKITDSIASGTNQITQSRLFESAYGEQVSKSMMDVKKPPAADSSSPPDATESSLPGLALTDKKKTSNEKSGSEAELAPPTVRVLTGGTVVTTHADGAQDFDYPDGTGFSRDADGAEHSIHKDGVVTTKHPDGSFSIRRPDGSSYMHYKNGNEVYTDTEGVTTSFDPNGTVSKVYQDFSTVTWNMDGSVNLRAGNYDITHQKDGTMVYKTAVTEFRELPNGDLVIRHIEGESDDDESEASDSAQIVMKPEHKPDGTVEWKTADGSVRLSRSPDGTVTQIIETEHGQFSFIQSPDGSGVQKDEDGSTVSIFRDGTVEMNYPEDRDLVSVRINTNKIVDVVYRDGKRESIHPDGSVAITMPDGTSMQEQIAVTFEDGTVSKLNIDGFPVTARDANGREISLTRNEKDEVGGLTRRGEAVPLTMSDIDLTRFEFYRETRKYRPNPITLPQALKDFAP